MKLLQELDERKVDKQFLAGLKEYIRGILSYFYHRQNYRYIEGNLEITLYKDRKTSKR